MSGTISHENFGRLLFTTAILLNGPLFSDHCGNIIISWASLKLCQTGMDILQTYDTTLALSMSLLPTQPMGYCSYTGDSMWKEEEQLTLKDHLLEMQRTQRL